MTKELRNFYKDKKVIVTGHTGFKGSWLCLCLKMLGAKVHGYSLSPVNIRGNLFELLELEKEIDGSVFGDVRDFNKLRDFIKNTQADIIIHMAAQPLVRKSYNDPIETYCVNMMGTVNLFEAIKQESQNTKAIINVTTDKCYENKEWLYPYRESDRLGGHDPYSASKACAELITSSYRKSFFEEMNINLASARAGNVIGGGDFAEDRIIPDIIEAISKKEKIILRNPNAIRPWQHVLDALFGYLILGMKLFEDGSKYSTAYNFAPNNNEAITVEEVTKLFISSLEEEDCKITIKNSNIHEATFLKLDNSKAKSELGWNPLFITSLSINYTAEWFKNYLDKNTNIKAFTNKQIKEYFNLINNK